MIASQTLFPENMEFFAAIIIAAIWRSGRWHRSSSGSKFILEAAQKKTGSLACLLNYFTTFPPLSVLRSRSGLLPHYLPCYLHATCRVAHGYKVDAPCQPRYMYSSGAAFTQRSIYQHPPRCITEAHCVRSCNISLLSFGER